VREALQQLRTEGLVRIVPQTGTFVFTMSAQEVAELVELRATLEQTAIRRALETNAAALCAAIGKIVDKMVEVHAQGDIRSYLALDTAFHEQIFRIYGNRYMSAAYSRISGKIAALRTHISSKPHHTELSLDEHRAMLAAMRAGRGAEIAAILAVHLSRTKDTYAANIRDIAQADSKLSRRQAAGTKAAASGNGGGAKRRPAAVPRRRGQVRRTALGGRL
jgi:DNA-binding GntR family transcriptional regulator